MRADETAFALGIADVADVDALVRYWDGQRWTFRTAVRRAAATAPARPAEQSSPPPPTPASRPDVARALERVRGALVGSMKEVDLLGGSQGEGRSRTSGSRAKYAVARRMISFSCSSCLVQRRSSRFSASRSLTPLDEVEAETTRPALVPSSRSAILSHRFRQDSEIRNSARPRPSIDRPNGRPRSRHGGPPSGTAWARCDPSSEDHVLTGHP